MAQLQYTYYSRIYREFKTIEVKAYRDVIHFFELNEAKINQLEFDERFELLIAYTNALFEIGEYERHLDFSDLVIETSIYENIEVFNEEDIYSNMLFRKAASLYQLHRHEEATHILRELLRINPTDKDSSLFLKKCLRQKHPKFLKNVRAVSVLLILLSAFIIAIELLIIRPFFEMHTSSVEKARNLIFITAIALLVLSDLYHRWRVEHHVKIFVSTAKEMKG